MQQDKPLQYFVVRSPFVELLLTGVKTFEFRTNAKTFANKRLALAVSKSAGSEKDLESQIVYWEKQLNKVIKKKPSSEQETARNEFDAACKKARKLFGKTNGSGKIIGEVLTGDMDVFDGEYGVHIIEFKLWPESEWLNSPGGLGLRYMPGSEHLVQNEPKIDFRGAYKSTFTRILDKYRAESVTEREKGNKFEMLMKRYLQTDPIYANSLTNVWLWNEFFAKDQFGGKDVGIDLVAETTGGSYWAIQCKCYKADAKIDKPAVDTFLATSGKTFHDKDGNKMRFAFRLWLDTTEQGFNREALNSLENQDPEFHRVGLLELENAMVDWERLDKGASGEKAQVKKKAPRDHQKEAIAKVHEYFKDESHERGKLIMACGTGKTYTSLCIAEKETDSKGTILFLVPSIALLGQTLREWTADASDPIKPICICSDSGVSRTAHKNENEGDGYSITDLALPASTNVSTIVQQLEVAKYKKGGMTVVFSTYQSIDVISKAQKKMGEQFVFDMIICDEAHRTTGATQLGAEASNFVKVHDNKFLRAKKRMYMTATPRLFSESSKKKAEEGSVEICSMDDPKLYGEEMFRIGFGEAVEKQLLSDYKVLVLTIDPLAMTDSLQLSLATDSGEVLSDDEAKLIGCFNALSKITLVDDHQLRETDPQPMKRAVAFSQNIKISKEVTTLINDLEDSYYEALKPEAQKQTVRAKAMHIDGGMGASARDERLAWLKADIEDGECRILNNVRCLSEGVDVPSLDAVLFLSARDSEVDVVQSVGRVMRTAPGKKYGYIIIPVIVPASEKAEDALNNNDRFKVVWKILNALRAHDDRFNAMVNKIQFSTPGKNPSRRIGISDGINHRQTETETIDPAKRTQQQELQDQLELKFKELQGAIYAKMVEKVGSRRYWEDWAKDVADIAKRHEDRIRRLIAVDGNPQKQFDKFLTALKKNLNPGVNEEQAIEMLSQHLITRPVFEALFEDYDFAKNNPVSRALQRVINAVESTTDDVDKSSLEKFYQSVKLRAEGVESADGKQKIIIELYDKFFKSALPKTVEKLGIVYTPVECVDFILHSVDDVLRQEFNRKLTDENVNIIDPFAGTGTFMTRLIQSGLINKKDLERKFKKELKTNEIVLLAYYIASVNIENAYHDVMGASDYTPFEGICLTDSFQLGEKSHQEDFGEDIFPVNGPRARAQKKVPIQVVIGNPPYSVGQKSGNDDAQNQKYPDLDSRIERLYAQSSSATSVKALYDSYIKAFRWATDRIDSKNGGVIGFITNGSWIDSNGMDGFRKSLEKEFNKIYVFNLRGNQRTSGELSRKEGGKIFGSGSRTPVSITILVKHPASNDAVPNKAVIKYYDIGDYLTREDKLRIIKETESITHLQMDVLHPNEHGDWINQRNAAFGKWISIEPEKKYDAACKSWFLTNSLGLATGRDAWAYNFSKNALKQNVEKMQHAYNGEVERYIKETPKANTIDSWVDSNPTHISWNRNLKQLLEKKRLMNIPSDVYYVSTYRPFCKQNLCFHKDFNAMQYMLPRLFPKSDMSNIAIAVSGVGQQKPFSVFILNNITDLQVVDKAQCFPLYYYEKPEGNDLFASGDYVRKDAVSDYILKHARTQYNEPKIKKEDIFYYVYGFLHSEEYRTEFAADLKKMLPRIPLVDTADEFWAFSKAGRKLAEIHLNYETADPYKALIVSSNQVSSDLPMFSGMAADIKSFYSAEAPETLYRVRQMRFAKKSGYDTKGKAKNVDDKTRIIYNEKIAIAGIPEEAYKYVVNGKSAIEWIMERYAVTTDKASGIVNDPNDWATEHNDPKYIFNLVLRIITVSLETMKIVKNLPKLKF